MMYYCELFLSIYVNFTYEVVLRDQHVTEMPTTFETNIS